ncbi:MULTISPECIES: protein kinase domain-containing protein [Rhodococcus]|uniref:Kelch repeat-containing protein n=1 Tax=Rhodococcus oxybenzonivorans TaxID=1990687 RepID=A0AAE4V1T4_9NOCA|nr:MULTISPECIES: kelch repeat-containing protein [Rhodococcus]MDV7242294.1 kelch repeat-containing protein [Rhodococcus oxybenzonivorans]MDV7266539.1 kelch repeat-containing protein [Rhodococcus oxybenzonivorans]MDV7276211.1 kelch repeat-containing protein [Rhodococcus oxybenzonivorans]MDV7331782.1 kelch repeat-containing protein [Rhodococcus oxybenzonivorans]MDV7344004.1 kelch repeat-containing protein [Rhodococcus oxybenzonivorans]
MADVNRDAARTVGGIVAELDAAGFAGAEEVGRGGFGVVYRCLQRSLGRTVAIKVLTSDLDPENRERFLREGYAMGGLSGHPNIVNILQVGVTDAGRPYIVMHYHPRDSLAVQIRREGPLPWPEAISIGVKLAGALETAHRTGTLHRDIKPANILLTDYGEPQLTDFGIAHIAGGYETATGGFTGSLAFTAPEVLNGESPTARSDVYGLGATIFSLIAGRAAFERRTGEELVAQFVRISSQPVPDLRAQGIPDGVCAAIERAMATNPAARPASAEEFGHELQAAQRHIGLRSDAMALAPLETAQTTEAHRSASGTDGYRRIRYDGPGIGQRQWVEPTQQLQPDPHPSGPPFWPPTGPPPWQPTGGPGIDESRKGRRAVMTVLALVVALVLAGGGYLVFRETTGPGTAGPTVEDAGASPAVEPTAAWRPVKDARVARQQTATTVADGTIWVFGGLDDNGVSARQEGYDPAINTWKAGPDLPIPLNHAMAVTYNDEPVLIGGWKAEGQNLTAVESDRVMAMRDGRWVDLPPLNDPRVAGAATVVGDKIVVAGGQADGELVATTEVFDGTKWTTVSHIPTPREHLAGVSDGTYFYAIGGRDLASDQNTAAVERYDPASDTWTTLPAMPTPRGGLGAAFIDGRIVTVGGEQPTSVLSTVEAYDVSAGTWSQLPALRTPRHGMAVGAVGNTVYAVGGGIKPTHAESTAVSEALQLAPRKTQWAPAWRPLKDAPIARQQTATAVADGTIWVLGGLDNAGSTPQVEGNDPAIDTWKAGPDLPVPLNHAMAVEYGGELVVLGGWVPKGPNLTGTTSDRVLALRNGKWVDLAPMNETRAAGAAAVVGDKIVVAGGQADGELVATTEVFDGTKWTTVSHIPTPREHLAGVSDGTYFYAIGGRDLASDQNTAAVERYDPASDTWTTLPAMPTPRGGLGAAFIDGRIVTVGGEQPTKVLSTVEAYDVSAGTWSPLPPMPTGAHGMSVATVGHTVYAIAGALRPTHAESTATAQALDFW